MLLVLLSVVGAGLLSLSYELGVAHEAVFILCSVFCEDIVDICALDMPFGFCDTRILDFV
jgi:hypothetical protein